MQCISLKLYWAGYLSSSIFITSVLVSLVSYVCYNFQGKLTMLNIWFVNFSCLSSDRNYVTSLNIETGGMRSERKFNKNNRCLSPRNVKILGLLLIFLLNKSKIRTDCISNNSCPWKELHSTVFYIYKLWKLLYIPRKILKIGRICFCK